MTRSTTLPRGFDGPTGPIARVGLAGRPGHTGLAGPARPTGLGGLASFTRRAAFAAALTLLAGCTPDAPPTYAGYVEGEYLYLAAPQGGYLETLDAARGTRVSAGQRVFALASDPDAQALDEAEARANAAAATVDNLSAPRRPPEIAALEASLQGADAALQLAARRLAQDRELARGKFIAQTRLDEATSAYEQALARRDAARQELAAVRATLGRQAEVRRAQADLQAAAAQVAQRRWQVARKSVAAPAAGEIAETYYLPGEWVPAGAPVASLLPDGRRYLRFFVPEPALATLRPGQKVEARCDGCAAAIVATITFIAPQAEYTPPVIYSRGSREKLVFRVEAAPEGAMGAALRPGLPVDVRRVGP